MFQLCPKKNQVKWILIGCQIFIIYHLEKKLLKVIPMVLFLCVVNVIVVDKSDNENVL